MFNFKRIHVAKTLIHDYSHGGYTTFQSGSKHPFFAKSLESETKPLLRFAFL